MTPDREPLWLTWSGLRPTLARTGARWKKTFPDWMRAHRRWALNYENLRAEVVPGSSPLEPDPLVLALYAELGRRREFDGHAHVAGAGVALALQTVLLAFAIPGDGIWSLHFAAALAALGIAIASLQTMGKHRYHQSVDARQMALLETRMGRASTRDRRAWRAWRKACICSCHGHFDGPVRADLISRGVALGASNHSGAGPPRDRREADLPGTCCGRWRSILGCGRRHRRGDRAVTGDTVPMIRAVLRSS